MLSIAFAARLEHGTCAGARLVVSAIAAKPRTITGAGELARGRPLDAALADDLGRLAHKQCHPLISVPYDADYRRAMVPVFVRRAVLDAGASR